MAENISTEKLPYKIIRPKEITLTMKDVGGYEEAKLEVIEYINFLKHPETYKKLGARMPRGMLLYGPPGTGKTLLARATAGEAKITFVTCAASSFLSGGNGPGNLKKVFELATKHAPCVLYFDEIDCIGQDRSKHWSGSITPVPQLLSLTEELLVQLDGFETDRDSAILVIGATNQICSLDQALLRPGRFDRKVNMDVPNIEARMAIFKVHLKPTVTKLDKDKLIPKLALLTSNFTGAEISATCNEAAMIAARESNEHITMEHFEHAIDRVRSGLRKKGSLKESEKPVAAYHEASHAVVGWFLPGLMPPTKLYIIPKTDRTKRLCSQCQIRELPYTNMETLLNTLALLTSGRVSELMMDDDGINTNSASYWDLEDATLLAMNIVVKYGLGKTLGNLSCTSSFQTGSWCEQLVVPVSDEQKKEIFIEVKTIVNKGMKIAKKVLEEHKETLDKVAKALIQKDMLSFDEMEELLGPCPIPLSEIGTLTEQRLPQQLQNWDD